MKTKSLCWVRGIVLFCALLCDMPILANVYATDIRINGSLDAGVLVPGAPVSISYVLNEPAGAGVTVRVRSGTNVIHTVTVSGGNPGAQAGLNSVAWDGTNDSGGTELMGIFTVSITAASTGYGEWTEISDNTNFSAIGLSGIDVNRNPGSPYYGRVFVGLAYPTFTILKCNADGSPAEDGASSDGGLPWGLGDQQYAYFSPWKIAVGPNDKVYINDFSGDGIVYAFDETISTNYQVALEATNYPYEDPQLSGLWITGSATNAQIWMADENIYGSAGILRWQLGADGTVATNDTGTVIVPVTNSSSMTWAPYDLAIDTNGVIYTIQQVTPSNPDIVPILAFAPYAGVPETNALWTAGTGDPNLYWDYGIAVDPTGTFVAVAIRGTGDPETGTTGFLNLYSTTNGHFVANIDQTGGDLYIDVAWDNVGNLYGLDLNDQLYRVYSPPGSNQATTVAAPFIQAYRTLVAPSLLNPNLDGVGLNFTLSGQSNVTYVIEQSPDLINWTPMTTNYSATTNRAISIPFADDQDFYRAVTRP